MRIAGRAKALLAGAGLLIAAAVVANQVVMPDVTEFYSVDRHSESSAQAARRGVLVARLTVRNPRVEYPGGAVTIREAWVERVARVRYRWYLARREDPHPRFRLVMPYREEGAPFYTCLSRIVYSDSVPLEVVENAFDRTSETPSFPPVIRIGATRRDDCPADRANPHAR